MRQDFIVYRGSCDKWRFHTEPTTLPAGRSLTLPDPDEANQSLAIDLGNPFHKSNEYRMVNVIMDRFTSYTRLVSLKDAATSKKTFKKLQRTMFDVHGLPLSILLDYDSRFTSKFWLQIMNSLGTSAKKGFSPGATVVALGRRRCALYFLLGSTTGTWSQYPGCAQVPPEQQYRDWIYLVHPEGKLWTWYTRRHLGNQLIRGTYRATG